MSRLRLFLASGICLFVQFACYAADKAEPDKNVTLDLVCNITVNNFNGFSKTNTTSEVILNAVLKHQPGGAILITQIEQYEFWVMTHAIQLLDRHRFINNFQVAIKDIDTGLFVHALSDSSFSPANPPHMARLSLVDYHPQSFLEKGELLLECVRLE